MNFDGDLNYPLCINTFTNTSLFGSWKICHRCLFYQNFCLKNRFLDRGLLCRIEENAKYWFFKRSIKS